MPSIPVISAICQLSFFVAIWFPIGGLYDISFNFISEGDPDARFIAQLQLEKITQILVLLAGGLLGAFLAWFALQKTNDRPRWFIDFSAVFASLWLMVFPIGTIVGFYMFRWRKPVITSHEAT